MNYLRSSSCSSIQNRFRSKLAWLSVLSLMLFVSKTYFNYDIPQGDKLVELILLVGTGLGIFNNPENSHEY